MSKDEDCVIKMKTVMDSGSNGQDSWCLELSLLQSGVCACYLEAYLKEGNHMGLESLCYLETVSECALGVCLYGQSYSSSKSQIRVCFACAEWTFTS